MANESKRIPVILDTDIGYDIDDTWALAMMLKSPELDVKLIVVDANDTEYQARIVARMLEAAGRTDIPIGIGPRFGDPKPGAQWGWVKDYSLANYRGTLHQDGVGAIIDTIMGSPRQVTLLCIGPMPNIGEALTREPRIAKNARFVGMYGSVYKGYDGTATISKECNVVCYTPACQKAFKAEWDMTITPLDTCGVVVLSGAKYQRVRQCQDPLIQALMENYRVWLEHVKRPQEFEVKSSVLFDTVAVYLAFTEQLLRMERLGIKVTDDGYTLVDPAAKQMDVAVDWKNLGAFEDFLVERLTGPTP
ncbi:MAG: nucleoside hydrolase [Lentisphaerae bacterium]|nr:nucleoside hydrolase [Lentisphaerota bacterium]